MVGSAGGVLAFGVSEIVGVTAGVAGAADVSAGVVALVSGVGEPA